MLGNLRSPNINAALINAVGQILLDPVCESEQEQWLWQNAQALASVQTGLEDV
jgi:hypothetical protein